MSEGGRAGADGLGVMHLKLLRWRNLLFLRRQRWRATPSTSIARSRHFMCWWMVEGGAPMVRVAAAAVLSLPRRRPMPRQGGVAKAKAQDGDGRGRERNLIFSAL
jgi:hypothetical protein